MSHHTVIWRKQTPLILPLAICFALAACSDKKAEQVAGQQPAKVQKQAMKSSIDRLVEWPEKDLRNSARKAVMEQRWYKPSGNSALEYYLALHKKLGKPDESVDTALIDILPYAVIGMDQAIANFDDKEALRLEGLIRMADPNAPALARVSADLEKMKVRQVQAEQNKAQLEQDKLAKEAKAKEDAAKAREQATDSEQTTLPNTTAQQSTPTSTAPVTSVPAAAPTPVVQAPEPVVQAPPQVVPAAKPVKASIQPISTPAPPYPPKAQQAGTKGQVVAEISINAAGDVTDVRIVNSTPPFVFDKTVLTTVRRWKFRGNGEDTTIRRTFAFN